MFQRSRLARVAPTAAVVLFLVAPTPPGDVHAQPPVAAKDRSFEEKIAPFLNKYCNTCHNSKDQKGGVSLDVYLSEAHARKDRKTWESIEKMLAMGEMPPKRKPQPKPEEKQFILGWIESTLTKIDCTGPKDPGRVTLRRLNRAEYNNTIRDLCGVNFNPADDFPSDDVGYGFDNIGDVLSFQPLLLEKYLRAADRVLDQAIGPLDQILSSNQRFPVQNLQVIPRSARTREVDARGREIRKIILTTEGSAFIEKLNFPATGSYTLRVRAWGLAAGGEAPKFALRLDGKDVKSFTVEAREDQPVRFEVTHPVEHGERRLAVAFLNPAEKKEDEKPRTLGVMGLEIEGPIGGAPRPLSPATTLVLATLPKTDAESPAAARQTLAHFARRAFRRPVRTDELDRLMKLFELARTNGDSFDKAIKLPLKAVLVSPHFLFRIEDDPPPGTAVRTLNDFEFATRLSYFLWASMPDEELFALAAKNELRKPGVLKAQIERMLKSSKSIALVENFAGQWLQLRNLKTLSPDTGTFRSFDENLRSAMIRESELFFDHVVKNDKSVLDFLDADYTFVNGRLARHYGIVNVYGLDFRQVKLTDRRRGGILTQASILTVTSNPTRTSPVKRGKWILENVLGTPPPPPAPDVPELPPVGQLKGTLRQQMEQHRANPTCATCHAKLDPLGFGLENFDGIGAWRDQDNKLPVDPSGVLPDGGKFSGPAELRQVLLGKADQFRRCLAEKLLTYALGRGLEYYDKCVLDEIVGKLKSGSDKFSALVLAIAESDAFQKRKGLRSE